VHATPTLQDPAPAPRLAAASRPLVSLRGVDKVYANGTVALSGVDLTIRRPEFVSLVGPSGCGKTTILRLVAGLGDLSSGTIEWPQADHDHRGDAIRDIGFVFQEPTLMPWKTVLDNVYLPFRLKGVPRRGVEPRLREALAQVGLAGFEGSYPRELSGGMRMRVSIARALATRPPLLLMDEPFAALDEITRHRLNDDLLDLWAGQDWTVVFVTHSVYESVYLSDRIVVMAPRPGRITADIRIDAPYPRGEAFRTSAAYIDHCREVSAALKAAMAAGGEG